MTKMSFCRIFDVDGEGGSQTRPYRKALSCHLYAKFNLFVYKLTPTHRCIPHVYDDDNSGADAHTARLYSFGERTASRPQCGIIYIIRGV